MDKYTAAPAVGLFAGLAGVVRNGLGLLLSRLELVALAGRRKHSGAAPD